MNLIARNQVVQLANIQTQLLSNLEEVKKWYKVNVDLHRKDQLNFKVGDKVWLQQQHIKTTWPLKKLHYQIFGPFTITKKKNDMAFQFKLLDSMKIHPMFQVSLLQPCHASTIPRLVSKPPSSIEMNGEQKYKVK